MPVTTMNALRSAPFSGLSTYWLIPSRSNSARSVLSVGRICARDAVAAPAHHAAGSSATGQQQCFAVDPEHEDEERLHAYAPKTRL